jgi:MoaA/NifB/PqqE/SkfB family radical SAM enzyme
MKSEKEILYRMNQTSGVTDVFSTLKNLEINLTDACNRTCDFCPHSQEDYIFKSNRANLTLFEVLSQQLLEKNYNGSIVLCGYGEPTMFKQLVEAVKILSVTDASIELITNGELLTPQKVNKLFESGLDVINISVYEEKYLTHAQSLVSNLHEHQWLIRNRYLGEIEIVNRNDIRKNIGTRSKNPCWLLAYKLILNHNGDVMLCCNDWTRSNIYGNIYTTNIWTIWIENLHSKRIELLKGIREGVCANCNIMGTFYGKASADFYENNVD